MKPADLKDAIRSFGCSQKAFAQHIGFTQEAISRMIHGTLPIGRRTELLVAEWSGPNPVNPPGLRATPPPTDAGDGG